MAILTNSFCRFALGTLWMNILAVNQSQKLNLEKKALDLVLYLKG